MKDYIGKFMCLCLVFYRFSEFAMTKVVIVCYIVGGDEVMRLTFMSDRQKGVLKVFSDVFPYVSSRYHVRHIITNVKKYNVRQLQVFTLSLHF